MVGKNKMETGMRGLALVFGMLVGLSATANAATPEEFSAYPTVVYAGKPVTPTFKGAQRPYVSYRTRIRQSVAAGPRFGGHYALAVIGCGAGCRFGYITDLRTGTVHDLPLGGEDYPTLLYRARADSRLLQTQWEPPGAAGEGCALQNFVWTGKAFRPVDKPQLTTEPCPLWNDAG